jgi:hypothetical protein
MSSSWAQSKSAARDGIVACYGRSWVRWKQDAAMTVVQILQKSNSTLRPVVRHVFVHDHEQAM